MAKKSKTKEKKKVGRKTNREKTNKRISEAVTKLTDEVKGELKELFSLDASVKEICGYLEITEQTYYNWKKKNKELFERLDLHREQMVLQARRTVAKGIAKEPTHAFRYLEKKRRDEFGNDPLIPEGLEGITFAWKGDKKKK